MLIDNIVKGQIVHPLRKFGLFIAKKWPLPVKASLTNGDQMWVDLRSSVGRSILVKGQFDYGVWRVIEKWLKPGGVFVDVGANVGYYSMLASSAVGNTGAVHAFEIDPRPLRCLLRNAKTCKNGNIIIYEIAVSDDDAGGYLQAGKDCGHSSLRINGDGKKVATTTLGQWADTCNNLVRIDVIKLDIEGGEERALLGARDLIANYRPKIICEALDSGNDQNQIPGQKRLVKLLQSMNYSVSFAAEVHSPTIVGLPDDLSI